MSIAANPVGEMPIAAQSQPKPTSTNPPRRTAVAKADAVAQPEPR